MSNDDTQAAQDDIITAATEIGQTAEDIQVDVLKDITVDPGVFQAGIWLKQLVLSRRATVEAHARELQMAMHEIDEKLKVAARQIVGVDQDNAENVQKAKDTLNDLRSSIGTRAPNLLEDDPAPTA
ncbi:hypothetical protein [Saccharopolyspora gloriosae]|uniref:hypothetical protein n=1 Tax=Saccharopolyspora gloriosae TaxID=455344 RepID=UPI001FB64060|nr:hypothetical protein [Saccharopolyspora gloriosae]